MLSLLSSLLLECEELMDIKARCKSSWQKSTTDFQGAFPILHFPPSSEDFQWGITVISIESLLTFSSP